MKQFIVLSAEEAMPEIHGRDALIARLDDVKGPFIPGTDLVSIDAEPESIRLTFKVKGGMDFRVLNAILGKLLRIVPKGTKLGPTRFAGRGEPFVLTINA